MAGHPTLAPCRGGRIGTATPQSTQRRSPCESPGSVIPHRFSSKPPNHPADSLHARLHGLLAPALRLALAVATGLPQSPAARGALLVFLRARAAVLTRVALDAARDGGRRGVGARELEQAALVVGLAGWVPGLLAEDPALQGAVYRLLYRFLCTDEASDSLAVARLRALRESGDGADEAAALADRYRLGLSCVRVCVCVFLEER